MLTYLYLFSSKPMAWKKATHRGKHSRYPASSPPQNEVNHRLLENCSSEGQLGTTRAHYQCRQVAISIPAARKASGLYAMAAISEGKKIWC
jgi:hypothetical protein